MIITVLLPIIKILLSTNKHEQPEIGIHVDQGKC